MRPGSRSTVAAASVVALLALSGGAQAATIAPSTGADVVADDGQCSLREAVEAADTNLVSGAVAGECPAGSDGAADTITLAARTYELDRTGTDGAGGDLDIDASVTITGPAGAATTIIKVDQAADRAIEVSPGATVTISGVTVRDGRTPNGDNGAAANVGTAGGDAADGGGIRNAGNLTLVDSALVENATGNGGNGGSGTGGAGGRSGPAAGGNGGAGGEGGGIYNGASGQLTLTRVDLVDNRTGNGGAGGSANGAQTAMSTQNASAGSGGAGGHGGAVAAASGNSVTLDGAALEGNVTGSGGAGGTAVAAVSNVFPDTGGTATGGAGGRGGDGGGLALQSGAATIAASTFSANVAGHGGLGGGATGGTGNPGRFQFSGGGDGGPGTGGRGGDAGRGGAARFETNAELVNVTMDANTGGAGGAGGNGKGGGGAGAQQGSSGSGGTGTGGAGGAGGTGGMQAVVAATLTHVTVTSNAGGGSGNGGVGAGGSAGTTSGGTPGSSGSGAGGAGGTPGPGGVHGSGGKSMANLINSVVASNTPVNCAGSVANGGGNISFGDTSCPGAVADPKLGPLADNGGPTFTRKPLAGSPAVDAVAAGDSDCPATDQRGVTRPSGASCDAGAVELRAPSATTGDATALTETGAKLGGSVDPDLAPADYHFQYGTTSAYGSATGARAAGSGGDPVAVAEDISGLAPDTTYHYRLVAVGPDARSVGADRTFRTAAAPAGQQPPVDQNPPPPDTDGDGVLDSVDQCPAVPGPAPSGCPPVIQPPPDATAGAPTGCFTVTPAIRKRTKAVPGGGEVTLTVSQTADPAVPLKITPGARRGVKVKSVAFLVNKKTLASPSVKSLAVPLAALKIGKRNAISVVVTLTNNKKVTVNDFVGLDKCPVPPVSCQRLSGGTKLKCSSSMPLRARSVSVTVFGADGRKATGKARVTAKKGAKKGTYTLTMKTPVTFLPGRFVYKHVATTTRKGEKLLAVRVLNLK